VLHKENEPTLQADAPQLPFGEECPGWTAFIPRPTSYRVAAQIVIVVLSNDDLEAVATRANLVQLPRQRYERVRLDPSGARDAGY